MMTKLVTATLVIGVLTLTGCENKSNAPVSAAPASSKPKHHPSHVHGKGPNDGVVFDLGAYHAEFTVNHDKKECYVLFVTEDDKDAQPVPVAAKDLIVTTKPSKTKDGKEVPAMTITLKPVDLKDGKAAKFVGTDPGLGNIADFEGTIIGEIDGKPAQGEFKE